MNYSNESTAVFLINDAVRAVMCTYEDDTPVPPGTRVKNATMFKTLDPDIEVDDLVVVPTTTRHKFTVVKVVEVDVDVDFNNPTKIDWIVQRVDTSDHEKLLASEKTALRAIRSAEQRREREKLKEALMADLGDKYDNKAIEILASAGSAAPETE